MSVREAYHMKPESRLLIQGVVLGVYGNFVEGCIYIYDIYTSNFDCSSQEASFVWLLPKLLGVPETELLRVWPDLLPIAS